MPSLLWCRFATSVVAGAKKWVRVDAEHVAVVLGGAMQIGFQLQQRIRAPNLPLASPLGGLRWRANASQGDRSSRVTARSANFSLVSRN